MQHIKILVAAALMFLVTAEAQALTFGGKHRGGFEGTRADTIEHAKKHFARLDDNSDGKVELSELRGNDGRRAAKFNMMVRILDDNDDNVITEQEYVAHATEQFDLIDTDKNGEINSQERKEARQILHAEQMKRAFEDADQNEDGVLSWDEYSNLGIYGGNPHYRQHRNH